ncbi:MAG TPA: hypothetical protein VJ739_05000 [Gemmataceae bacterium]|nr:hypothetical protein [Gemmataceae bacterium]
MQLLSWLHQRTTGRPQTRHTPARKPAPRFRPRLETLERRDVPSTLTVTSPADSGAGTLRADVAAAGSGDTIVFDPSLNGQTIALTSGQIAISKNLTIQGPGAGQLTISHNAYTPASRIFEVDAAAVTISGLTLSNGYDNTYSGGGAILNRGLLNVSDCTLSNNHAYSFGGAIDSQGGLTVSGCTFTGNRAGEGGALFIGWGTATVSGSTLSGNSATYTDGSPYLGVGGAIYNQGDLTLLGTTVTRNTSASVGRGGGIFFNANARGAKLNIAGKSVVTGNRIYDLFFPLGPNSVTISSDSVVGQIGR